jgi:hypothetical protein
MVLNELDSVRNVLERVDHEEVVLEGTGFFGWTGSKLGDLDSTHGRERDEVADGFVANKVGTVVNNCAT